MVKIIKRRLPRYSKLNLVYFFFSKDKGHTSGKSMRYGNFQKLFCAFCLCTAVNLHVRPHGSRKTVNLYIPFTILNIVCEAALEFTSFFSLPWFIGLFNEFVFCRFEVRMC